jgi:hypothetical protein
LVLAACGPANIGTKCSSNGDCGGGKDPKCVPGFNSGPKICTHVCFNNADCPFGYDCAATDTNVGKTCNQVTYAFDKKTGDPLLFAKPCPTDDSVCQGTGDKNAMPMCRKGNQPSEAKPVPLDSDPDAYCTGSCNTNDDCPLPMKCDADYDGVKKCLKRNVCDECQSDDNCGYTGGVFRSDFNVCVPVTRDGKSGFYCSKQCVSDGDCPGAAKRSKWMTCQPATDADGNAGNVCLHWYGACTGDGNICDPCRTQDECGAGLKCIDNPYGSYSYPLTGERMCNKRCSMDSDCKGPNMDVCDNTDIPTQMNPYGTSILVCIKRHVPGVFACNL